MQIDKNVPLPDRKAGAKRKHAWIDEMEIGDSVLVDDLKEAHRIRSVMYARKKKAVYRQIDNLYRVWRIS